MPADNIKKKVSDLFLSTIPGLVLSALTLLHNLLSTPLRIMQGELHDADSFMHLARLRSLLADGHWHDGFFLRDNAPFGMVIHWTKAYDIFFLTLAAPIAVFTGWDKALHVIAFCFGPISIGLLILAAIAAARPFCDRTSAAVVGLTVATAPLVLQNSQIGDADHHVLIAAIWIAGFGLILRVAMGSDSGRTSLSAGVMMALALWVTAECVLGVMLAITVLALAWIREGEKLRDSCLRFSLGFCVSTAAFFLFDPPYGGFLTPDIDRLSIVYVAFAVLLACLWLFTATMSQAREKWRPRLFALGIGAMLCALALGAGFSKILAPEKAVFGKGSAPDWAASVAEMLPAYQDAHTLLLTATVPLIALAYICYCAWNDRKLATGAAWIVYGVVLAPQLVLGLVHIRFMIYPEVLAGLAIAKGLASFRPLLGRLTSRARMLAELLATVLLVNLAPSAGAQAWAHAQGTVTSEAKTDGSSACRVQQIATALNDTSFMGGDNLILMTSMGLAPEVLYWSHHRVVAGPYHRNIDGINDEFGFFASEQDKVAKTILTRRGVSFVLICPAELALMYPAAKDHDTLASRLVRGEVPDWLEQQAWPAGIESEIRLFRVKSR